MQSSAVFKNIGRIAIEMYLLFQHHTTVEILRNVSSDMDLFTITGTGWHFVKYLGPAVVVVGPDCRSERTQSRVMAGPTYQGLFPKVAVLPPSVQHCIWMLSVPVVYPRLETMETLANTFATGKKAVNMSYNILGKVTSSVAGVVGGKEMVQHGFKEVKKAVGKSGLMGNVLNQFGEIDVAEELRDLWTHESKDLERTYLIRTLQGIAQQKGIRMTFLSGGMFSQLFFFLSFFFLFFLFTSRLKLTKSLSRRQRLWCWSRARPFPPQRPQDYVPDYLQPRRGRAIKQLPG
jgi:PhoD related phosphatase